MKLEIHADIHIHSHGDEKELKEIFSKLNQIIKAVSTTKSDQKTINSEAAELNDVANELQNSVDDNTHKSNL